MRGSGMLQIWVKWDVSWGASGTAEVLRRTGRALKSSWEPLPYTCADAEDYSQRPTLTNWCSGHLDHCAILEPREERFDKSIQDGGQDVKICSPEWAHSLLFRNKKINLSRRRNIWKNMESGVKSVMLVGINAVGWLRKWAPGSESQFPIYC